MLDCPFCSRTARFLVDLFHFHPAPLNEDEVHWDNFAASLPRARFVVWLAYEVATDLACKNHGIETDVLVSDVLAHPSAHQHHAETYLQSHLHLGRLHHTHPHRVIVVFRELIQHRLRTH